MEAKGSSRAAVVYLFALTVGAQSLTAETVFYKVHEEATAQFLCSMFNSQYATADGQPTFHWQPSDTFTLQEEILLDEAVEQLVVCDGSHPGFYHLTLPKDALRLAGYALRASIWENLLKRRSNRQAQEFDDQHSVADTAQCPETKVRLTDTEKNTIKALGRASLTGEKLAEKAGYPFNSNFKNTLSSLRKRGILGNSSPGYFVTREFRYLLHKNA